MSAEPLPAVDMIMVAARSHPLSQLTGIIPKSELAKHVQLVLTDRSELTQGREFGVMSPLTWRLSDLYAKHSFLLKGQYIQAHGLPARPVDGSSSVCGNVPGPLAYPPNNRRGTPALGFGTYGMSDDQLLKIIGADRPHPNQQILRVLGKISASSISS
jgi:hypothetical protein